MSCAQGTPTRDLQGPPTITITVSHQARNILHDHNATEMQSTEVPPLQSSPDRKALVPRSRYQLKPSMETNLDLMGDRLATMDEENSKHETAMEGVQHTHISVTQQNKIVVQTRALEMILHWDKPPTTIFSSGELPADSSQNPPFLGWSNTGRKICNIPRKKNTQEVREAYPLPMPPEATTPIETLIPIPPQVMITLQGLGLNESEQLEYDGGCSQISGLELAEGTGPGTVDSQMEDVGALPRILIGLESYMAVPSPSAAGPKPTTAPMESAWLKKFGFKNLGSAGLATARCGSMITESKLPTRVPQHHAINFKEK